MKFDDFKREDHIFSNETFIELVKDAVRFLHGTPAQPVPPVEKFSGSGVYVLYYMGDFPPYSPIAELNRLAYQMPIYVGKAVPSGWRQGRLSNVDSRNFSLYSRLREHSRNLKDAENLELLDFACRFMIFEGGTVSMVSTVESFLIREFNPLWNAMVDGFGNHDPGKGRYEQEVSAWDILHAGRAFARKLQPGKLTEKEIADRIIAHLSDGKEN